MKQAFQEIQENRLKIKAGKDLEVKETKVLKFSRKDKKVPSQMLKNLSSDRLSIVVCIKVVDSCIVEYQSQNQDKARERQIMIKSG